MKALKWFLVALGGITALLFGGALFLKSTFSVERSIDIVAPADKVYGLIANPRHWKQWSVWNRRDPAMEITYSGPESGSGATWAWKSKSEGDGRMSFTTAEPGRRLGYDLFFPDFGTTSKGEFTLQPLSSGTRVTWRMDGDMGQNLLYRWFALGADRMVGADFQDGLAGLKQVAEKP